VDKPFQLVPLKPIDVVPPKPEIREQLLQYNNYLMKQLETSRSKQFLDI
jgi:hypothetical protein